MRKYNQAFIDNAHRLYNQCGNMCEVGRKIGVHSSQIWRWKAADWKIRKRKVHKPRDISQLHVPIGKLNERDLLRALQYCL